MFKIQDEATETALCTGVILALLWGLGVSVQGLTQDPGVISWSDWFIRLAGGIVVAMIVPPALVRTTEWITRRIEVMRRRPSRVPHG